MVTLSFSELDHALAQAAEDARVQGLPALRSGQRALRRLLRHAEWPDQTASLKAEILQQGAGILLTLFKATGKIPLLQEAATLLRSATGSVTADDPRRPFLLINFGVALRNLGTEHLDDLLLREAAEAVQTAVDLTAPGDPERPRRLSNLSLVLRSRYALTNDLHCLDAAVDAIEAAFAIQPTADLANNLAAALHDRHARRGLRSDLERAIDLTMAGLAAAPGQAAIYPRLLANNALYRSIRFQLDGHPEDGAAAIAALKEAVEIADWGSPDHSARLCSLGNAYLQLFQKNRDPSLLEAAIIAYEAALDMKGLWRPQKRRLIAGLSSALALLGESRRDARMIRRGVALARSALRTTPAGSSQYAVYAHALATALRGLGLVERSPRRLIEAVELLEGDAFAGQAVVHAKLAVTRAGLLADLFDQTGNGAYVHRAAKAAGEGAQGLRLQALSGGAQAGDIELASDISLRAGVLLARIGDTAAAAPMLERARTVRFAAEWSQRIQAPAEDTAAGLDWREAQTVIRRSRTRLAQSINGAPEDQAERRMAASSLEAGEAILLRIARGSNMPPDGLSADGLVALAKRRNAALVYLFDNGGGGALIVTGGGVAHLGLPGLSAPPDAIAAPGLGATPPEAWLDAYQSAFGPGMTPNGQASWKRQLEALLLWLGQACAAPLLAAAAAAGAARIVLLPAASLALLPFHAAIAANGLPLGEVIPVEYAPSATLLLSALDQPVPEPTVAVFGDANGDLPFSRLEAIAVAGGRWPLALDREVSRDGVLGALARAGRTHLAIHARFEPTDPLGSTFQCTGSDAVHLSELLSGTAKIQPGAVIVASGCETAVFDRLVASAEQVGFGAALLGAGARGVVATLWPVDDLSMAAIMHRASRAESQGADYASALRSALSWIRTAKGEDVAAELEPAAASIGGDAARRRYIDDALQRLRVGDAAPFAHPWHWAGLLVLGVVA